MSPFATIFNEERYDVQYSMTLHFYDYFVCFDIETEYTDSVLHYSGKTKPRPRWCFPRLSDNTPASTLTALTRYVIMHAVWYDRLLLDLILSWRSFQGWIKADIMRYWTDRFVLLHKWWCEKVYTCCIESVRLCLEVMNVHYVSTLIRNSNFNSFFKCRCNLRLHCQIQE